MYEVSFSPFEIGVKNYKENLQGGQRHFARHIARDARSDPITTLVSQEQEKSSPAVSPNAS